ncbi:MAG TPA: microviridin/marinostatin family tricyclic proteinase inhibitor [Pyrinomonadaceae bacterium]|jgi:hypothetical protein|nr:microviridin/marinostatin family tricyclic proteinase inhibitor [Pyrinomonadaceae bacterium]
MPENTDPNPHQGALPPEGSLPFFTRFLEGQNKAECSPVTHKFPSDNDEMMTQKWPSDGDDDPPAEDSILYAGDAGNQSRKMTLKYPSDRDEVDFFLDS